MGCKNIHLTLVTALILLFSCNSTSNTQTEAPEEVPTEIFDPNKVSQERYISTREDVQHFIRDLNDIISRKDFNAWKAVLSSEYIAAISSPRNLNRLSEMPAMQSQKIVLKNLEDYFNYVVAPSRANVTNRVDNIDIEFVDAKRVKAFVVTTNRTSEEQRVRLYDLEQYGNSWKIIN